jgi:hypothetical protein
MLTGLKVYIQVKLYYVALHVCSFLMLPTVCMKTLWLHFVKYK